MLKRIEHEFWAHLQTQVHFLWDDAIALDLGSEICHPLCGVAGSKETGLWRHIDARRNAPRRKRGSEVGDVVQTSA